MTTSSDYVDGVLRKFIARHDGQYLDHSHAYGPQSPDVIEYYLTELLGRPWQFRAGFASRLWDDPQGVMAPDFERVERDQPLRPGDVLVFGAKLDGPGTVGIFVRPGGRVGSVQMFTQNPGPATTVDIMRDGTLNTLLGAWRLTYAAECKIIADKFAAQLHGDDWPEQPKVGDVVRGMQVVSVTRTDEELPGRAVFVGGRGHGKTAFIERLKAKFGRGPK